MRSLQTFQPGGYVSGQAEQGSSVALPTALPGALPAGVQAVPGRATGAPGSSRPPLDGGSATYGPFKALGGASPPPRLPGSPAFGTGGASASSAAVSVPSLFCSRAGKGDADRKAFETARARAALAGYCLTRSDPADGEVTFQVSRWNLSRTLRSIQAVDEFLARATSSAA